MKHLLSVNFKNIILGLIILLGIFLRFYKINSIPPSISWDEASIGYNAYLVSTTSKDEWGEVLPIHFQAFGEWKLPVYIYSTIPFIRLFGLNQASVRLPSYIAGIISALVFGLIWLKLKGKKSGVVATILFLFNFWSFSLSRSAFETNLALSIYLTAVYFALNKKYLLSSTFFVATMYTYNGFRITTPITLLVLFFYLYQKDKRKLLLNALAVGILSAPFVFFTLKNPTALSRISQVAPEGNIIINTANNYFKNFSPSFLLFNGDSNLRHFPRLYGEFSYLSITLFLIGIIAAIKTKNKDNLHKLLFLLLAISPIPTAITKDSPHALRSILMVPSILSFSVIGFNYLDKKLKARKQHFLIGVITVAIACQYLFFYNNYFSNYPEYSKQSWQYGYEQMIKAVKDSDKNVYITDSNLQPYIFYLFYTKKNLLATDYSVSHPKNWHRNRVDRIDNFRFLSNEEVVDYLKKGEEGVFVVDYETQINNHPFDLIDKSFKIVKI